MLTFSDYFILILVWQTVLYIYNVVRKWACLLIQILIYFNVLLYIQYIVLHLP